MHEGDDPLFWNKFIDPLFWNKFIEFIFFLTWMLTPPRQLIPPPVYPRVRVSPFVYLTCNSTCVSRLITLWYLSYFNSCTNFQASIKVLAFWAIETNGHLQVTSKGLDPGVQL
jgi:hypothetical protein